jgi:hypothetical protein
MESACEKLLCELAVVVEGPVPENPDFFRIINHVIARVSQFFLPEITTALRKFLRALAFVHKSNWDLLDMTPAEITAYVEQAVTTFFAALPNVEQTATKMGEVWLAPSVLAALQTFLRAHATNFQDPLPLSEEVKVDVPNLCMLCDTDMGPENPRQLCGKTTCDMPTKRRRLELTEDLTLAEEQVLELPQTIPLIEEPIPELVLPFEARDLLPVARRLF